MARLSKPMSRRSWFPRFDLATSSSWTILVAIKALPCAGSFDPLVPSCSFGRSILPTSTIEQVFAKLKHLLRKAAARTIENICIAIGKLLDSFTPAECANYFKNSGYAST
jgi:hypothetical protein